MPLSIQRMTSRKNEDGASAVEYGLLVAAIAAVIVTIVFLLGGVVNNVFTETCTAMQNGTDCAPAAPAAGQ